MNTTTTKTVTRGIYSRVPTGRYIGKVEQISTVKTGERVNNYIFEVVSPDVLKINGNAYRVESCGEFAIKIMKTRIKANGGASGLLKFFMSDSLDAWETKVIENCKPIQ